MVPKKISKEVQVDENALLEIVDAPQNFSESLEKFLAKKESFSLIVGPDLYTHPNAKNLARLVALLEKYSAFKLVMIPSLTNTLGVSLICDLDDARGTYTVGYNTKGDFTLSALGKGDLDMPALNQQEGTLTSIDKRVNPTNAAVGYKGYELNDIANALGLSAKLTVDYTVKLPPCKGFKAELFDNLPNRYENDGTEVRGYTLDILSAETSADESVEAITDARLDGTIIYLANPVRQFSEFTNVSANLKEEIGIYMSESYLKTSDFNAGDTVKVKTQNGELSTKIISDNKIEGEIATLPTFDSNLNSQALFSGYRFSTATIQGV